MTSSSRQHADTESEKWQAELEFEREKWRAEINSKDREFALKEREQTQRESELTLKQA
jgi:hypothetical protein